MRETRPARGWLLAAVMLICGGAVLYTDYQAAAQAATGQDTAWKPAINNVMKKNKLPSGFVYLDEVIPEAQYQIRYYGKYNFTGAPVSGYKAPLAIATSKAATALKKVSEDLSAKGYILRIYDAYRPQKAVNRFVAWSRDASDIINKQLYYPELDKQNLFQLGFISKKSGHSRGSTVDLTLADKKTGTLVDMGSPYDFFGEISYYNTTLVSTAQHQNRKILKDAMVKQGFKPYAKEWWHFTLINEPYPAKYFDFNVE
ncbi:M15 family metallopeptidase [Paenibacillus sp. FSL R7-0273]|uniref:M15 family metallopeptidase n=1 Tax=Paenibacillus sp. FSL R7-0273 TaxID=1536772 RepID=UPI000AB4B833|nr:M15 family metallopeptidase [Paenibacillus sp. FSL R7-0273]